MGQIIRPDFVALAVLQPWERELIPLPTYYHEDALELFELIADRDRFSDGLQWFCRGCGSPCSSIYGYAEDFRCFVLLQVLCHLSCHAVYRAGLWEPIYPRLPRETKARPTLRLM